MELRSLSTWNFRNLQSGDLNFSPGINLVLGANGQGKTNLLEAIAALGNLRSFRRAAARKMVRHGEHSYRLEGKIINNEGGERIRQLVELGPPVRRQLEINGSPVSLDLWLAAFPVFSLSGGDANLVVGPPDHRRALLDRLAFFCEPRHLADLQEYRRCLRQRNAALNRGSGGSEMDLWEHHLAAAAARIVVRRAAAVSQWQKIFAEVYGRLKGDGFPTIETSYRTDPDLAVDEEVRVAENYQRRYHENRARDRHAGFTLEGPHRHDLSLRAGGRSVRDVLSAGQIKVVAGALCLSTLMQVEGRRKENLPILVDDADAEIDDRVLAGFVAMLGRERQIFMSSAHESNMRRIITGGVIHRVKDGTVFPNDPSEVRE